MWHSQKSGKTPKVYKISWKLLPIWTKQFLHQKRIYLISALHSETQTKKQSCTHLNDLSFDIKQIWSWLLLIQKNSVLKKIWSKNLDCTHTFKCKIKNQILDVIRKTKIQIWFIIKNQCFPLVLWSKICGWPFFDCNCR